MKAFRLLCAITCLTACAASQARASVISTVGFWNGSDNISPFGFPSTATIGQTFLVTGPEAFLNNFSTYIDDVSTVQFKTYLMQWDNTLNRAVGPILYQANATTTNNGGSDGYERISFSTGALPLVIGQTYVIFESISEGSFYSNTNGTARIAAIATHPYPDGTSVSLDNNGNPNAWTTTSWTNLDFDAVFEATISLTATPEPSSLVLFGAVAVGFVTRRRRFGQETAAGSRA